MRVFRANFHLDKLEMGSFEQDILNANVVNWSGPGGNVLMWVNWFKLGNINICCSGG